MRSRDKCGERRRSNKCEKIIDVRDERRGRNVRRGRESG